MLRCVSRMLLVRAPVARARAERAVIAEAIAEEAKLFTKSYHSRSDSDRSSSPPKSQEMQGNHNSHERYHQRDTPNIDDELTFPFDQGAASSSSAPASSQRNRYYHNGSDDARRDDNNDSELLDDDNEHHKPEVVNSLQDFFSDVRRMRRDIGKASSRDRVLARQNLVQFWNVNIGFAMASCVRARDIGFVSFYGVTDSHLELPAHLIPSAIQLLIREADVCNALDTSVSLRYLSREVSRVLTSPKATAEDRSFIPPQLVTTLVEHGLERLQFLFVTKAIAEPEDAVHGLEFILSLCNGQAAAPALTEVLLLHAARGSAMMTSLISCFGILRASMPKLEHDVSAQICLELLRAVKRKDDKLRNPFHFVKILVTMVRLDSKYLTQPALWQYIILKACIFAPNASREHRRIIVMSIRTMLQARGLDNLLSDLAQEIQGMVPDEYDALIVGPIGSLKTKDV